MMQSFWQMIVVILITHIWTGCDWTYPCSHECLVHKNTNLTDDQQPVSCTWSLRRNMCEGSSRRPTCKRDHVPLETVNLEVNFPNMYISKKSQKNLVLQKIYIKKIFLYSCRVLLSSIVKPEKAEQSFRNIYTNDLIDYFDFIFTLINW